MTQQIWKQVKSIIYSISANGAEVGLEIEMSKPVNQQTFPYANLITIDNRPWNFHCVMMWVN